MVRYVSQGVQPCPSCAHPDIPPDSSCILCRGYGFVPVVELCRYEPTFNLMVIAGRGVK